MYKDRETSSLKDVRYRASNMTLNFGIPSLVKKKLDAWRWVYEHANNNRVSCIIISCRRIIRPDHLFEYSSVSSVADEVDPIDNFNAEDEPSAKDSIHHIQDSTAAVVMINNKFEPTFSNISDLLRHNISLRIYNRFSTIPEREVASLFDLPEAEDLPLRLPNDIIGSEFLAWHNLVSTLHCFILINCNFANPNLFNYNCFRKSCNCWLPLMFQKTRIILVR